MHSKNCTHMNNSLVCPGPVTAIHISDFWFISVPDFISDKCLPESEPILSQFNKWTVKLGRRRHKQVGWGTNLVGGLQFWLKDAINGISWNLIEVDGDTDFFSGGPIYLDGGPILVCGRHNFVVTDEGPNSVGEHTKLGWWIIDCKCPNVVSGVTNLIGGGPNLICDAQYWLL